MPFHPTPTYNVHSAPQILVPGTSDILSLSYKSLVICPADFLLVRLSLIIHPGLHWPDSAILPLLLRLSAGGFLQFLLLADITYVLNGAETT